jgi:hypothetical protein
MDEATKTHLKTIYIEIKELNERIRSLEAYTEELTLALRQENPKMLALLQAGQKLRQAVLESPGYTNGYNELIQSNLDLIQGNKHESLLSSQGFPY